MTEKQNLQKQNNLLWIICAVVMVVVGGYLFLTDDLEHIEDANGPDNYALVTITDENIIKQDVGALNVQKSTGLLNDGITFSSKKFTGVYRVFVTNFFLNSDFQMDLAGFWVNGGNFRMCIVNNDEIIADVEPGLFPEVLLHDLNGSFELVIAGVTAHNSCEKSALSPLR